MRVERTNFEGDWSDICPYCGHKQEVHKEIAGEYKGVRYEHRMPCDAENQ
jgi:sarcosine oxidase delta subunit